jgi:pilus assembly protein CpaB
MNRRLVTILLAAFIVAALCSVLVYRLVGMRIAAVKPQPSTRVVAAATDIKIGTVLGAPDLTTVQIQGTVPKTAILDAKNAIGRGVISPLYAGEPIMDDRLAPFGSGGGLAATIKDGYRAIAVRVDQVVGVAGFVLPGMRVDLLASAVPPNSSSGGGNNNTQVRTILQNIEVLSAGTDIQKDAEGKPQQVQVVNLLVTPEQAQVVALASNEARIQLVLRNPLDSKVSQVSGTAMTNLFTDQNQPAAKPKLTGPVRAPKPKTEWTVTVINGSTKTEDKFATPGGKQ